MSDTQLMVLAGILAFLSVVVVVAIGATIAVVTAH